MRGKETEAQEAAATKVTRYDIYYMCDNLIQYRSVSPTLNGSLEILYINVSNVIKICDGLTFDFCNMLNALDKPLSRIIQPEFPFKAF